MIAPVRGSFALSGTSSGTYLQGDYVPPELFCSRSPCQRLWAYFVPFPTTTSGTFVLQTRCFVYTFFVLFEVD